MPNLFETNLNSPIDGFEITERRNSGLLVVKAAEVASLEAQAIPQALELPTAEPVLYTLSEQELLSFQLLPTETDKTPRPSAELALAITNPHLFLAREIERHTGENEVSLNLGNPKKIGKKYTKEVTQRRHEEGETKTQTGDLEDAGIVALNLLKENEIASHARGIVLSPLNALFQEYRLRTGQRELPEMPELTMSTIDLLDVFSAQPEVRFALYKLLEQTRIPSSLNEEILRMMDKFKDLDHPLAFQLTLSEQDKPNSAWTEKQTERRRRLLSQLEGTNQSVYENFDSLMLESQGLVMSGAPHIKTSFGWVGIEIEFVPRDRRNTGIVKRRNEANFMSVRNYEHKGRGLGSEWSIHQEEPEIQGEEYNGPDLFELTRTDENVAYNMSYKKSLVDLHRWFGDYAKTLETFHMHFDKSHFPVVPSMGGLFEGIEIGRQHSRGLPQHHVVDSSKKKLPTWEVRGISLPRSQNNLHPARINDIIFMYGAAAKSGTDVKGIEKIHIGDDPIEVQKLTFGHISSFITRPQGRLAALMALHDEHALSHINPLAFVHSYQREDLQDIVYSLVEELPTDEDRIMLGLLYKIGMDNTVDAMDSLDEHTKFVVEYVLGDQLLEQIKKDDYSFDTSVHWNLYLEELLRQHHPASTGPIERLFGGVGYDKEKMKQEFSVQAKTRLEKLKDPVLYANKEAAFRQAFTFDRTFKKFFLERYTARILLAGLPARFAADLENTGTPEWQTYMDELTGVGAEHFQMYYALTKLSEKLTDKALKGEDIDFDKEFTFNEKDVFETDMQALHKEMDTFYSDKQEGLGREVNEIILANTMQELFPVLSEESDKHIVMNIVAYQIWAIKNGVGPKYTDPVEKALRIMIEEYSLPTEATILIKAGLLGSNLKKLEAGFFEKNIQILNYRRQLERGNPQMVE